MNSVAARMVFDNAKKAINKAFPIPEGKIRPEASEICKLTQSYLRLERLLEVNKSVYEFPILINDGITRPFNTEQRLNLQDSFVCSEVGIFIIPAASETDATALPLTYCNPDVLGANAVPMQAIYAGQMNIAVNNDILVPSWDLLRHLVIPETQRTAAPGEGSPLDELFGHEYGFYPMEPNVVFIGSKNNALQIKLPAPLTAVLANSRLAVILRGVLAQNSTVVS